MKNKNIKLKEFYKTDELDKIQKHYNKKIKMAEEKG